MSLNTSNIIHIVAEVVTLLAITTYFLHQNRKMNELIDSLTERLEEQEEKIEKHDKVISDILKTLKSSKEDGSGTTTSSAPQCVGDKCVLPTPPFASMLNSVFLENPFPQFFAPSVGTSSSVVEEADSELEEDYFVENVEEPQQEIIEEEEEEAIQSPPLELVQDEPQVVEIKDEPVVEVSKKKKKKKKKSNSVSDIDKELEDELNDLYKEEIMRNNS